MINNIFDWLKADEDRFNWFTRHISNSSGQIKVTLSDTLEKSFKKVEKAAEWLTKDQSEWLCKNTDWYYELLQNTDSARATMIEILKSTLDAKRQKAEEIRQDSIDNLMEQKVRSMTVTSSKEHNDVDRLFLEDIVYCDEDMQFYTCTDKSYVAIGSSENLSNKRGNDQFVIERRKMLGKLFWKDEDKRFELWGLISAVASRATDSYFNLRRLLTEAKTEDRWLDTQIDCLGVKYKNLRDFEQRNKLYHESWEQQLHTVICTHVMEHALPTTLFNRQLASIKRIEECGCFRRYAILPENKQCTLGEFYAELFSSTVTDVVPHISRVPHICSEDDKPAKYHIKPNWRDLLSDQKPYEECKALKAFLENYTDDERTMLMAWAYSVLHPSVKNTLGLLIKTGGGSFKTNVFARQLKALLDVMYGANCHFTVIRDKWTTNEQYCETAVSGFSRAELIFNDECTEDCITKYKDMSGSTLEAGVDYSYKVVYKQPVNTKLFAKFLFCTNEGFTITDAQGVYDRRLAIIDRMDIKKLPYPYPIHEFDIEISKEMLAFHDLAEEYYNKLMVNYSSIEDFARRSSIADNLKAVYNEDAKKLAAEEVFEILKNLGNGDNIQVVERENGIQLNVANGIFCETVDKVAADYSLNPKGLRNYITDVNVCGSKLGIVKINGKTKYGLRLKL